MDYDQSIRAVLSAHRAACSKMKKGIVFVIVAFALEYFGIMAAFILWPLGLLMIIASLPFWGVGIPFLIMGIIRRVRANKQLSSLRAAHRRAQQEQEAAARAAAAQEAVAAPVVEKAAEQADEVTATEVVEEPISVIEQPTAEPVTEPAEEPVAEPVQESAAEGAPALDWQQYSPLECGVSYDKTKDYQFHRAEGFVGSVPQTFVNRTFLKCPVCCSKDPHWTIAQHNQMSWKGNLYLFKCSCCEGIVSMSMPDVTTLSNGGSGVATHLTVGLTNLAVKSSSGKEAGAIYGVIETVGKSGLDAAIEGKEFKLEHLQDMSLRA